MSNLSIWDAKPSNIWCYRQNHPEYVIDDIRKHFPIPFLSAYVQRLVRRSMLCRGINKWLKVRRDLIAYKKQIKHEIVSLESSIPSLKQAMSELYVDFDNASIRQVIDYYRAREEYRIAKALLKYKQKVRGDLKALCMTERWQEWEGKELEDMNSIKASDTEEWRLQQSKQTRPSAS